MQCSKKFNLSKLQCNPIQQLPNTAVVTNTENYCIYSALVVFYNGSESTKCLFSYSTYLSLYLDKDLLP